MLMGYSIESWGVQEQIASRPLIVVDEDDVVEHVEDVSTPHR